MDMIVFHRTVRLLIRDTINQEPGHKLASCVALFYYLNQYMPLWKDSEITVLQKFQINVAKKIDELILLNSAKPDILPAIHLCASLVA